MRRAPVAPASSVPGRTGHDLGGANIWEQLQQGLCPFPCVIRPHCSAPGLLLVLNLSHLFKIETVFKLSLKQLCDPSLVFLCPRSMTCSDIPHARIWQPGQERAAGEEMLLSALCFCSSPWEGENIVGASSPSVKHKMGWKFLFVPSHFLLLQHVQSSSLEVCSQTPASPSSGGTAGSNSQCLQQHCFKGH